MKKILFPAFAMLFLLACATAQQQTPFFLNKQGAVAEYAIKGPDGALISYARSTVTTIDSVDEQNFTVSYNVEALDANRNAIAAPTPMTTIIKDGTAEIAPNAMGMEIVGKVPSYPANLSEGQEFEYNFTLKMMGVEAVTKAKEKVSAHEEITTPAGKFDCFKIESNITVTTMGQTQNMKTITWMSAGIGIVKMETRDTSGNIQVSQELVSLKK
jgi:hypothetical protein